MNNMNSDWYKSSDWYCTTEKDNSSVNSVKTKLSRKGRIIAAVIISLLLIAGIISAVFFLKNNVVFSFYSSEKSAEEGELPDNYIEFFDNFYLDTETEKTVIGIPNAPKQSFWLEINSDETEEMLPGKLFETCSNSIVAIKAFQGDSEAYAWGSGVIISEDGLIITNTHVLANSDKAIVVLSDDREYDAQLVGADSISDIAVLKIEETKLNAAKIGNSDELRVGDRVAAIGNPLGVEFRMTMTDGIISGISRGLQYNGHNMALLQTNAALNEGNSGGALFNMYGKVIGLTNMKMMSSYYSIEGIAFAIPSVSFTEIVNELIAKGIVSGRTSIGITVGEIPEVAAKKYDLPEGLYVNSVVANSDAAKKGIRQGDIVTAINGEKVSAVDEVNNIKDLFKVGDNITLTIYRNGKTFDVEVMLIDTNTVYG